MEYISLSWSDISELLVPITISLIEGFCYQRSYLIKDFYWLSWNHHFERFTGATMTWFKKKALHDICVTDDQWYITFFAITIPIFPHSRLITGLVTRVTRCVTLVEQELFLWCSYYTIFNFLFCFIKHCLSFCLFFHCIVCSSISASDDPFDISNLLSEIIQW